jgi:hypothetical protein
MKSIIGAVTSIILTGRIQLLIENVQGKQITLTTCEGLFNYAALQN